MTTSSDNEKEKTCSKCNRVFSFSFFHKNSENKTDGLRPDCKSCSAKRHKKYYKKNYGIIKERKKKRRPRTNMLAKEWRKNNPEKVRAYNKSQYEKNSEIYIEYQRTYRKNNKERLREYHKNYSLSHRKQALAKSVFRRARKLCATLPGFEKDLKDIYKKCPAGYHVDHVVPLVSKLVCGLHVPWNLQYLTKEENLRKSNKLVDNFELENDNE